MQALSPQSQNKENTIPKYLYIIGTFFLLIGIIAQNDAAGAGCCLILIGLLITAFTPKKPAQMIIRNVQPQYVVQPQVVYQQQQYPAPTTNRQPVVQEKAAVALSQIKDNISKSLGKNNTKSPSPEELSRRAKELELARDWQGAAEMYQEAGMYEVAGRIRKKYLEKGGTVVNIAKVGDTHVHDSVVLNGEKEESPTCPNCKSPTQAQWNTCPHCQNELR
ncbi:MAG TPA: zinc ribbon domain-containing protein [Candidatus Poseidoniales archaeon]|jgi:hypothetical protein|nr:zinc ribbon domain-containing protein [Candidatus Poseidoniales archaeon]